MFATILLPAIPVFAIGGVLITSDTPLVCCWTWAAVWAYPAIRTDHLGGWVVGGIGECPGCSGEVFGPGIPGLGRSVPAARARHTVVNWSGRVSGSCRCSAWGSGWPRSLSGMRSTAGRGPANWPIASGFPTGPSWGSIWPILGFLGGEAAVLGGVWWVAGVAAIVGAFRTVDPARESDVIG